MQPISSLISTAAAQATGHLPKSSGSKPAESSTASTVSPETVMQVSALFARMAALFRNKAKSEGLIPFASPAHEQRGEFTDTFKLWCVKLKDLCVEDFARGTLAMEQQAEEIYKFGDERGRREMWPPSFAEFRALCFPASDYDRQAHRMAPSLWDPVAQCYRLEDQTAKAKRMELGRKESGELLKLLGEKPKAFVAPEVAAQTAEFAKMRLEQAKRLLAAKSGA